jgi:hypothetical protein
MNISPNPYMYKRMCLNVNAVEVLYSNILVVATCTNVICFFLSYYNSSISVNISIFYSILNIYISTRIFPLYFRFPLTVLNTISYFSSYFLINLYVHITKCLRFRSTVQYIRYTSVIFPYISYMYVPPICI